MMTNASESSVGELSGTAPSLSVSRRRFMGAAAAAATLTIVPRHVLGGPGNVPPSERLSLAFIGVGGRGADDLAELADQNVVALCDVDWQHAAESFQRYPDVAKYRDFREMLDAEDDRIDGVVVAAPDHIHAVASMAAVRRGKHVYCEKPLTHSVHEARALAAAAKEYGVATQMGNQGQASEETRLMCEYIWDGALGQVGEVHVWTDRPMRGIDAMYWPQGVERPKETPQVPEMLDWDLWLGPAPARPYHPSYAPFNWRGWWDFGTGALGDMGCHQLDPVFRALKLGHPSSVQASCSIVNDETYPVASRVVYEFGAREGMSPVTVHWYDGGIKPPRPAELSDGEQFGTNGVLFIGDEGKMLDHRLIPESRRRAYGKPPEKIERSPGHHAEWVRACKGGSAAGSNFVDHAALLTEVVLLGNIALRPALREKLTRTKLMWDASAGAFANVPEANVYLGHPYRQGWSL